MCDELVTRLRRYHDNRRSQTVFSEAADAIEELSKYANTIMRLKSEGWYLQQTKHHDGYAAIATMPLPEPPKGEVRHGRWEWDRLREAYRCSCCDNYNADRTAFCPNCGADLREDTT